MYEFRSDEINKQIANWIDRCENDRQVHGSAVAHPGSDL
jgi:hypothetical protein